MANFDKEKMTLVDYLIKKEKYTVYRKKPKYNNNIYLYKIDHPQFQIIKITDKYFDKIENFNFDDEIILQIKQFLNKKIARAKLNILAVAFFENNSQFFQKDNNVIMFVDSYTYDKKIAEYFPNFKEIINDQKYDNIGSLSQEELIQGISDKNSPLAKNIMQIKEKTRLSNLVGSWFFLAPILLFIIISLIVEFFSANSQLAYLNFDSLSLVFGGLTRDLVVWSLQIWRLWTFPFYGNFVNLLICFFLLYISIGYLEISMKWWRLLLLYLILTPIMGLFLMAVFPNSVISGPWFILAAIFGAMKSYNYQQTDLVNYNSRIRSYLLLCYLILFPLLNISNVLFLVYLYLEIISVILGSYALTFILKWNKTNNIIDVVIPGILMAIFFITALILLNVSSYVPAINYNVIDMYNVYISWKISSSSVLTDMYNNYYFYTPNQDSFTIANSYYLVNDMLLNLPIINFR